ncbi:anthranilate synthase component I, partial [Acinetobacter baumannii]
MTTLAQFEQLRAAGYNTIPVYRQRLADTEPPLSVFARFMDQTQAYVFESVDGGETWA